MKIFDIMNQQLIPLIKESLSIMPNNKKNVLNLDNLKKHSGYIQWYLLNNIKEEVTIDVEKKKSNVLLEGDHIIEYYNNSDCEEKIKLIKTKHLEAQEIMKQICSLHIDNLKQNPGTKQSQLSRIAGITDNIEDNNWIMRTLNSLLMDQNIIRQYSRNNCGAYFEVIDNNKLYTPIPFIEQKNNMSKLESECALILNQLGLNYQQQMTIPGCKYKKPLRFDFYILDYDLYVEIDGAQHYKYTTLFHKNLIQYFDQILRDRTKDLFVHDQELNFLRIRYDENIKKKLLSKIKELKN